MFTWGASFIAGAKAQSLLRIAIFTGSYFRLTVPWKMLCKGEAVLQASLDLVNISRHIDIFLAVEALAAWREGFSAGAALPGAQVMHALATLLSQHIPFQKMSRSIRMVFLENNDYVLNLVVSTRSYHCYLMTLLTISRTHLFTECVLKKNKVKTIKKHFLTGKTLYREVCTCRTPSV